MKPQPFKTLKPYKHSTWNSHSLWGSTWHHLLLLRVRHPCAKTFLTSYSGKKHHMMSLIFRWHSQIGPQVTRSCFFWSYVIHCIHFTILQLCHLQCCQTGYQSCLSLPHLHWSLHQSPPSHILGNPASLGLTPSAVSPEFDLWCMTTGDTEHRTFDFKPQTHHSPEHSKQAPPSKWLPLQILPVQNQMHTKTKFKIWTKSQGNIIQKIFLQI